MIEAVIFDIGGVLERNPRTNWQRRWAARLGLDESELGRRLAPVWASGSIGSVTLEQVHERVADALALDEPQLAELMGELWDEYLGTLNEELALYFASLRPRHRTAIISNSFVGAREREQVRYGFADLCDVLIYSHEVGCMKPERRIFELACERLGVCPERALFLDDVAEFTAAARAFGMQAVTFTDNASAIAAIKRILGGG